MKKRMCFILLLCLMIPMMSSCRGNETEENKDLIVVGFSQLGSESSWRLANTASMQDALSEKNGFELVFDNAKQKQENQLIAVRNFILQDVDYIVIAPNEEQGWDSVLAEAEKAGIPVIIVDRQVRVADESLYVSYVGSDFQREGETAIKWLEKELVLRGKQADEISILHLQGTEGSSSQIGRTDALLAAVAAHPGWSIASVLQAEYTEAKAYEMVRDFLKTGKRFNVLYSENDNMTFGALRALDEYGITCGPDGDVTVISFDAVKDALQLCLDRKIDLCVECNPLHGSRVVNIIHDLENGNAPEKNAYVDETYFTYKTLDQETVDSRAY